MPTSSDRLRPTRRSVVAARSLVGLLVGGLIWVPDLVGLGNAADVSGADGTLVRIGHRLDQEAGRFDGSAGGEIVNQLRNLLDAEPGFS